MPEIGRIQSTTFQALLTRLGIVRNEVPFVLRSEVSPVVLVGGEVAFIAAPTPAYAVTDVFTAGRLTAPAVDTVLADTGALPVGSYTLQIIIYCEEAGIYELEWRNAGNTADLVNQRFITPSTFAIVDFSTRFEVQNANERFRVLNVVVGGVGVSYQATILAKI